MIRVERVTTALFDMQRAALGVPVGDHGAKLADGTPIDTDGWYVIGWKIDGGEPHGSLGDAHQDLTLVYQFDTVGRTRQQCEGGADRVRAAMLDVTATGGHVHALAGTGFRGGLRSQQTTGMPTPEGTDDQNRPVWTMRERFEVQVHRA